MKVLKMKHVYIYIEGVILVRVPSSPSHFLPVSIAFPVLKLESHVTVLDWQTLQWFCEISFVSTLCSTSVSSPNTSLSFPPTPALSLCHYLAFLTESAFLLYVICDTKHLLVYTIYVTLPHKIIYLDLSKDSTAFFKVLSWISMSKPCEGNYVGFLASKIHLYWIHIQVKNLKAAAVVSSQLEFLKSHLQTQHPFPTCGTPDALANCETKQKSPQQCPDGSVLTTQWLPSSSLIFILTTGPLLPYLARAPAG